MAIREVFSGFSLLYPEVCIVSAETILTWYRDAVENGEVEGQGVISPEQAAAALNDSGIITLQKR